MPGPHRDRGDHPVRRAGGGRPGHAAATAAALVASAFDLYLHVVAADGGARIIEIGEPRASGTEVALDVALSLYSEGSKRDPAGGRLQGRGVSARLGAAMAAAGSTVPSSLVGK